MNCHWSGYIYALKLTKSWIVIDTLYLYECVVIREEMNFRWPGYICRNSLRSINRWIVIVQVITKEIRWNSRTDVLSFSMLYLYALKFRKRLLFIVRIISIKVHWILGRDKVSLTRLYLQIWVEIQVLDSFSLTRFLLQKRVEIQEEMNCH